MNNWDVKLSQLSIGYPAKRGAKVVATGINGIIRQGQLTCLLGANGVGKSTLLRTLSAFQPKLSGSIIIGGHDISHYAPKELSRLIGVVLTEKPDVRNMTVSELVALGRSPYTGFWGNNNDEDLRIVGEAISQVGIEKLRGRTVDTLSDGERQKVMIAKALAQQTPIILLDEPTAHLDLPHRILILRLLRRLAHEQNKTILISTHELDLALALSDRILLMTPGKGIRLDTTENLKKTDAFTSAFGMDIFHYL